MIGLLSKLYENFCRNCDKNFAGFVRVLFIVSNMNLPEDGSLEIFFNRPDK